MVVLPERMMNRPLVVLRAYWLDICAEEDAVWLDPEIIELKEAA